MEFQRDHQRGDPVAPNEYDAQIYQSSDPFGESRNKRSCVFASEVLDDTANDQIVWRAAFFDDATFIGVRPDLSNSSVVADARGVHATDAYGHMISGKSVSWDDVDAVHQLAELQQLIVERAEPPYRVPEQF